MVGMGLAGSIWTGMEVGGEMLEWVGWWVVVV